MDLKRVSAETMQNSSTLPRLDSQIPYYEFQDIKLYNGDVTNPNLFKDEFIDLIVTSPPYNVGIEYGSSGDQLNYSDYLEFSQTWLKNCYYWSRNQARLCLNIPLDKNKGGQYSVGADLTRIAQDLGWKYHSTIIWNEGNISRRTAWGSWLSASAPFVIAPVELIVVLYKDQWKKTNGTKISTIDKEEFMEWTNGLWTFNGESKKRIGHPAPFPRELPRRCIKLFSYLGDTVFEPFCGSATTLIEAYNNQRKGVGVEIDLNYCELGKRRFEETVGPLFIYDRNLGNSEVKSENTQPTEQSQKNPIKVNSTSTSYPVESQSMNKYLDKEPLTVLTQQQLSERLGVSSSSIRNHVKKGDLGEWSATKDPDGRQWKPDGKKYSMVE